MVTFYGCSEKDCVVYFHFYVASHCNTATVEAARSAQELFGRVCLTILICFCKILDHLSFQCPCFGPFFDGAAGPICWAQLCCV